MARSELSTEQLQYLLALLPPERPKTGRPARDLERTVRAILWVNRTGSPWRDLPGEFGPWQTAASRFYHWRKAGVWERVLELVQAEADEAASWTGACIRSTARLCRPPARRRRKRGQLTQALGRSRGGFSTKIHLRADRHGLPLAFVLSPGQAADQGALTALMEAVVIRRTAGGRPRQRPDRAYSSQVIRT